MKATIHLNDGSYIDINKFQSIKTSAGKTYDQDGIQFLALSPNVTYNVIGDITVSVKGDQIQYIGFDSRE